MSCLGLTGVELQLCRAAEAAEAAAAAAGRAGGGGWAEGFATFAEALGALLLPLALILVILWLRPYLGRILESRAFTLKVGGFELSAQEATDQIRKQIEDLQAQVAALKPAEAPRPAGDVTGVEAEAAAAPAPARPKRLLWVDDNPGNNAMIIAAFRDEGIEVTTARTTADALNILGDIPERFGAVVTDQSRLEDGKLRSDAGNELIRRMKEAGMDHPVAVFASSRGARMAKGAEVATASTTELRRFVERHLGGAHAD